MAKAQQKPKGNSGTRNSDRRNGKAFSKWNKENKPTGKTILGYKRDRVEAWAKAANVTLDVFVEIMKAERKEKKERMRENRAQLGKMLYNLPELYRKGILVHKPTPVLNKKREV